MRALQRRREYARTPHHNAMVGGMFDGCVWFQGRADATGAEGGSPAAARRAQPTACKYKHTL